MSDIDVRTYYEQSYPPELYGPPPEPTPPPVLTALNPSTMIVNVEVTVTLTGSGFTEQSSVVTGNMGGYPATFISDTELTILFTPIYVSAPDGGWMKVRNGVQVSNEARYTVVAALDDEEGEP